MELICNLLTTYILFAIVSFKSSSSFQLLLITAAGSLSSKLLARVWRDCNSWRTSKQFSVVRICIWWLDHYAGQWQISHQTNILVDFWLEIGHDLITTLQKLTHGPGIHVAVIFQKIILSKKSTLCITDCLCDKGQLKLAVR